MKPLTKALDKNVLLVREWLNLPGYHSDAAVFAEVSLGDYLPVFKLSDCFRKVTVWLEYDPADQETMDNALHKMDVIIDAATRTKAAMVEAMAHHKEHPLPKRRDGRGYRRRGRSPAPVMR